MKPCAEQQTMRKWVFHILFLIKTLFSLKSFQKRSEVKVSEKSSVSCSLTTSKEWRLANTWGFGALVEAERLVSITTGAPCCH